VLQPAGLTRPKANRLAALGPRADRRQHDHAHTARPLIHQPGHCSYSRCRRPRRTENRPADHHLGLTVNDADPRATSSSSVAGNNSRAGATVTTPPNLHRQPG
jgi:hypothetical protein